eukprot:1159360-Pelagomonas_calceolata.AAC.6
MHMVSLMSQQSVRCPQEASTENCARRDSLEKKVVRSAPPDLASLSPGKALSLDSLPHDTQSRGAMSYSVSGKNPAMQGQHMQALKAS